MPPSRRVMHIRVSPLTLETLIKRSESLQRMKKGVLAAFPCHTGHPMLGLPGDTRTESPTAPGDVPALTCSHHLLSHMAGVIRFLALFATLLGCWFIAQTYFERGGRSISLRSWLGEAGSVRVVLGLGLCPPALVIQARRGQSSGKRLWGAGSGDARNCGERVWRAGSSWSV